MNAFKNSLLRTLESAIVSRLHLRLVNFEVGHELEYPGRSIDHLFFVESGMASITNTFKDGSQIEVGMFGYEGVIGLSALMGTKQSLNRVYTQIAGYGFSCTVDAAHREFQTGGVFQDLALRYVQAQLLQAMQSAGCNAKHRIEQRLARWLLLCSDRVQSKTFHLSQEYIADMLGTNRPSVSVAAGLLKSDGLIEYSRGKIRILEAEKLEKRSCECYQIIKDYLDNYAQFDSGILAERTI